MVRALTNAATLTADLQAKAGTELRLELWMQPVGGIQHSVDHFLFNGVHRWYLHSLFGARMLGPDLVIGIDLTSHQFIPERPVVFAIKQVGQRGCDQSLEYRLYAIHRG